MREHDLVELMITIFPDKKEYLESDDCDLDYFVYDKFDVETQVFGNIVDTLLPLASRWKSDLTDIIYSGFVDDKRQIALVKVEIGIGK